MSTAFADAIGKAVATAPMGCGPVPILPNRVLRADGDGLAYYCAGKDGSDPADAKAAVLDKLRSAAAVCGASRIEVLLTASGSTKGGRYAVATVKPYQGQRSNSRRPENWRYLRDFLETYDGPLFKPVISGDQEADDLFAQASANNNYLDCVIYTQDKDMRTVPGVHLEWVNHSIVIVPPGTWSIVHNDKVYGRKWFWLQMLHGDTADHIPGLPRYGTTNAKGEPVFKPVGEVTANNALAECTNEQEARAVVEAMYRSFYDQHSWEAAMQEQAILLWLQRSILPLDVFALGGPLQGDIPKQEIKDRINRAQELNELARKTQDNSSIDDPI